MQTRGINRREGNRFGSGQMSTRDTTIPHLANWGFESPGLSHALRLRWSLTMLREVYQTTGADCAPLARVDGLMARWRCDFDHVQFLRPRILFSMCCMVQATQTGERICIALCFAVIEGIGVSSGRQVAAGDNELFESHDQHLRAA